MSETKEFPVEALITIVTGIVACESPVSQVGAVLSWMSGERIFTHQIGRVMGEAAPLILAAYPQLAETSTEVTQITADNWSGWLVTWRKRYGITLAVPRMTADQHERIDPESELLEKIPPDRILKI